MRKQYYILFGLLVVVSFLFQGCSKEDPLSKLKELVPIFEGSKIIESKVADEKTGIIMMEVEGPMKAQKSILDFYKTKMTNLGWELKSHKDYGKNGSVMELVKEDIGTLSVVTILKKTEKTGIIPVTLNLSIN